MTEDGPSERLVRLVGLFDAEEGDEFVVQVDGSWRATVEPVVPVPAKSWSNTIAYVLVVSLILCFVLLLGYSRRQTATQQRPPCRAPAATQINQPSTPVTKKERIKADPPESIDKAKQATLERSVTTPLPTPRLRQELSPTAVPNRQLLARGMSENDARDTFGLIFELDSALRTEAARRGVELDRKASFEYAFRTHELNQKEMYALWREMRERIWHGHHREIDRQAEERRHHERMSVQSEEKEWASALDRARKECNAVLRESATLSLVCIVGFRALIFVRQLHAAGIQSLLWSSYNSIMDGCDDFSYDSTMGSYYSVGLYAMGTYLPSVLTESICQFTRCLFVALAGLLCLLSIWIVRALPRFAQHLCHACCAFLVAATMGIDALVALWRPTLVIFLTSLGSCFLVVQKYEALRLEYCKRSSNPSSMEVNVALDWFHQSCWWIQLMPYLFVLVELLLMHRTIA